MCIRQSDDEPTREAVNQCGFAHFICYPFFSFLRLFSRACHAHLMQHGLFMVPSGMLDPGEIKGSSPPAYASVGGPRWGDSEQGYLVLVHPRRSTPSIYQKCVLSARASRAKLGGDYCHIHLTPRWRLSATYIGGARTYDQHVKMWVPSDCLRRQVLVSLPHLQAEWIGKRTIRPAAQPMSTGAHFGSKQF